MCFSLFSLRCGLSWSQRSQFDLFPLMNKWTWVWTSIDSDIWSYNQDHPKMIWPTSMVTTSHQILSEYVANRIRIKHLPFTSMNTEFTHNTLHGWGWGTVFSPSLVTIPEATTLTQLSLSMITRQFLPPILVRIWNFEVLRQSSFSLGLATSPHSGDG